MNADVAGDIGLSCGGTVDLFVEPLLPSGEMIRLCRAVAGGIEERAAITILTGLEWNGQPKKAAFVLNAKATASSSPDAVTRGTRSMARASDQTSSAVKMASVLTRS